MPIGLDAAPTDGGFEIAKLKLTGDSFFLAGGEIEKREGLVILQFELLDKRHSGEQPEASPQGRHRFKV